MWGCIAGDIAGSVWEGGACPAGHFQLFPFGAQITDDSVCVAAIADAIVGDGDFAAHLRRWVRLYPSLGYGADFKVWALTNGAPAYGSWSNGAAMRVSPVALAAGSFEKALELATISARVSHDHPDAVAGARALAAAIWLALDGASAVQIRGILNSRLRYAPRAPANSDFTSAASATVPVALWAALGACSFEGAIERAVTAGGDTDTIAAMAGGLAEALFGIPISCQAELRQQVPEELHAAVTALYERYPRR